MRRFSGLMSFGRRTKAGEGLLRGNCAPKVAMASRNPGLEERPSCSRSPVASFNVSEAYTSASFQVSKDLSV
jgi:hypothetical protein